MMRFSLFRVALVAAIFFGHPARAALLSYTGSLSVYDGPGLSAPVVSAQAAGSIQVAPDGSFSLAPRVFSATGTTPVGFTPNAAPNGLFVHERVWSVDSAGGTFAPGLAPAGGFGGMLGLGGGLLQPIGIVPLPFVYATVLVPGTVVGSGGAATAMGNITANAITVAMTGTAWTTGSVVGDDPGAPGDPATHFTVAGAYSLPTAIGGTGQIRLVTPFTVRTDLNFVPEVRVGYAELVLNVTLPEPAVLALLALAGAALVAPRLARER